MINRIVIGGRLTADPQLRRTETGKAVCSFVLAVERDYKNQNGEREADFITVTAWRNTAEYVNRYCTKGRMVAVDGRLQIRSWKDENGAQHWKAEVVASNVYFLDFKRDGSNDSGSMPASNETPAGGQADFEEIGEEDGELPF